MKLSLIIIACLAVIAESKVPFQSSTILDEYDLNGNANIALDVCKTGGCSIFISANQFSLDNIKNVYVQTGDGTKESLYKYANEPDPVTGAKKGFKTAQTAVSIVNENGNQKPVGPIVIYVVGSQAPNYNSDQVEIYDVAYVNVRPATNKKMTMIMTAEPYNLYVSAYGGNLNAVLRATGFDNNYQQDSADGCRIVYQHNEGKPFRLRVNSPVLTINFDGQFNTQICATVDYNNVAPLDYAGMATSQGYIGCESNQFATYRSTRYTSPQFDLKDTNKNDRQTDITYAVNTINTDTVRFTDYSTNANPTYDVVTGDGKTPVTKTHTANAINIQINYGTVNNYGSSYWVGYKPKTGAVTVASGEGVCTDWGKTTTSTGVTQTTPTTTTSGANGLLTVLTSAVVLFFSRQL